jgi:hypothetical protein
MITDDKSPDCGVSWSFWRLWREALDENVRLREENARLKEDCAATSAAWAQAYDAAGRMFAWMSEHASGWAKPLLLRHDWLPEAARACRTALDAPEPDDYLTALERLEAFSGTLRAILANAAHRERCAKEAPAWVVRGLIELQGAVRAWLAEVAVGRIACKTNRQSLVYWGDEEE